MANEVYTQEQSTTGLLKGIVSDVGDLIKQEVKFARAEIKEDFRKTKEAIVALALGAGVAVVGVILLSLMLVHLLHWLSFPAGVAPDAARIPLWGSYGIVGVVFLGIGAALVLYGMKKLASFNPLPDQTVQSVKENVGWIANSK